MILSTRKFLALYSRSQSNNIMITIILFFVVILSHVEFVESFLLASSPSLKTTSTTIKLPTKGVVNHVHQHCNHRSSRIIRKSNNKDSDTNDVNGDDNVGDLLIKSVGLASQPVVWISLYSLATTGHGLPAGPGGIIGAVEGIAYLVVVALALPLPISSLKEDGLNARILSRISIALGLLILAGVAVGKGCVPNAKPILDYSAYLPVCGAE